MCIYNIYMYMSLFVCLAVWLSVCLFVCLYVCILMVTSVQTHTHTDTHRHKDTQIHRHTHRHTDTHTHTETHTHTPLHLRTQAHARIHQRTSGPTKPSGSLRLELWTRSTSSLGSTASGSAKLRMCTKPVLRSFLPFDRGAGGMPPSILSTTAHALYPWLARDKIPRVTSIVP